MLPNLKDRMFSKRPSHLEVIDHTNSELFYHLLCQIIIYTQTYLYLSVLIDYLLITDFGQFIKIISISKLFTNLWLIYPTKVRISIVGFHWWISFYDSFILWQHYAEDEHISLSPYHFKPIFQNYYISIILDRQLYSKTKLPICSSIWLSLPSSLNPCCFLTFNHYPYMHYTIKSLKIFICQQFHLQASTRSRCKHSNHYI